MPHTPPPLASTRPLMPPNGRRASHFSRAAGSRSAAFAFWISQCWQAQEHDSRNGCYGILDRDRADHSGLMPANLTTLPHFSVSSAINAPNSVDVIGIGSAPRPLIRALSCGSASPAVILLLSLSMIAAGVPLGAPMPIQPLAS